jgi:hypothetical protein
LAVEGAARERRAVAAVAKYFILVTSEVLLGILVGGMGKRMEGCWCWDWCWGCGLMLDAGYWSIRWAEMRFIYVEMGGLVVGHV